MLSFLSYVHLSAYIHQCYICNVGDGSDSNKELQYEIQFVKVFTTQQFVSESLKYNCKKFKTKIFQQQGTVSNFLQKSKTSDNVKYISLPAKPSANKSSVERFLKAIRSEPVYFCVVSNRCLSQMLYYLTYLKVQHR